MNTPNTSSRWTLARHRTWRRHKAWDQKST